MEYCRYVEECKNEAKEFGLCEIHYVIKKYGKCRYYECKKCASYKLPDSKKYLFCASHKLSGMNPKVQKKKNKICDIPKPILKWVGGKTQILDRLTEDFPKNLVSYREIFLGGGSVLLAFLQKVSDKTIKVSGGIYAYDLNEPLIYVYKNIQENHNNLYDEIQTLISEFNSSEKKDYYYNIRNQYNNLSAEEKKTVKGSAMFIFMNKTCFRGVFRVGPNGFNVPYGNYSNPEIINKEHLEKVHNLIQGVAFECRDFRDSLESVEEGDFVYLDPPYAPEKDTSFVGYTNSGFNAESHNNLFEIIHTLSKKNVRVMMSNSDVDFVRQSFSEDTYVVKNVVCKRSINSKNPESKTKEVIITNYQPQSTYQELQNSFHHLQIAHQSCSP